MFHSNSPNWRLVTLPGATNRTFVPDRIVSSDTRPTRRRTALASPTSFAYVMCPPNHVRHADKVASSPRRRAGRAVTYCKPRVRPMKLKKARVQNYWSIHDTGWFDIEDDKTVIVGPNEAGKTAVLRALQTVNMPPG